MEMINKVTTVIVTYGNRWELLKQVLNKISRINQIGTIIVVDNGSEYNVFDKINELNIEKKVLLEKLKTNTGSAGGYRSGIKKALEIDEDFMLLLDDDTFIESDSLMDLSTAVNRHGKLNFSDYAYCFFRPSWIKNNEHEISYYFNTFFEFSVFNKILKRSKVEVNGDGDFSKRPYAPYAGLFMRKEICRAIELPNDEYYLYVDDTDFTYGLYSKNYQLFCYKGKHLLELEESWAQQEEMVFFKAYFFTDSNGRTRANYNIRNRVNFEWNNLAKSKFIYLINMSVYLVYILFSYMPKNKLGFSKFKTIIKYIVKGIKGDLGKL